MQLRKWGVGKQLTCPTTGQQSRPQNKEYSEREFMLTKKQKGRLHGCSSASGDVCCKFCLFLPNQDCQQVDVNTFFWNRDFQKITVLQF